MLRTLFVFIILILGNATVSVAQQDFQPILEIYNNWKKYYANDSIGCTTFYYTDKIDSFSVERVISLLNSDSVFFTDPVMGSGKGDDSIMVSITERKEVIEKINTFKSIIWRSFVFENSGLVCHHKIPDFQNMAREKTRDPVERLCYTVYAFSEPAYFRNNSYCVFFTGKTNYAINEGECWIYKLKGANWVRFAPLYRWIE